MASVPLSGTLDPGCADAMTLSTVDETAMKGT